MSRIKLEQGSHPLNYYVVRDGKRAHRETVRIDVEAEYGATRKGIENTIINAVNREYKGADYHERIHEWDKFTPAHKLYVLLSDWGDSLDCTRILDDIAKHIPEMTGIADQAKGQMSRCTKRLLDELYGNGDGE